MSSKSSKKPALNADLGGIPFNLPWKKFNCKNEYNIHKNCKKRFSCIIGVQETVRKGQCEFIPLGGSDRLEKIFVRQYSSREEVLFWIDDTNYYVLKGCRSFKSGIEISQFIKGKKIKGTLSKMDIAIKIAKKAELPIEVALDIIESITNSVTEASLNGESWDIDDLKWAP
ncbi:MAG: hypothetical protein WC614_13225 [bacterium]